MDVDAGLWWAPFVDRLYELEVRVGCRTEPAWFCPERNVTRAQMATFLKRAFDLEPAAWAGFVDVDAGGTHSANIDALAAARITVGCRREPLRYCPDRDVNRAQMATFLARALGLVELPASVRFTALDVGSGHSCGVRVDGTVACWGDNASGESESPDGQFKAVAASVAFAGDDGHSCGLRVGGTVACWGHNASGQADAPRGQFSSVAAGSHRSCGVRTDGTVECWGGYRQSLTNAPRGQFSTIAAGSSHQCGVRIDGTVECWGSNRWGESLPPSGRFMAISVGFDHSCGVRTDGTLDCWGLSLAGQTDEPEGMFIDVGSGRSYSCGIRAEGTVECWGGVPDTFRETIRGRFSAISVHGVWFCGLRLDGSIRCEGELSTPPEGSFSSISVGQAHACAVRDDSEIACWGNDDFGQTDAPDGPFESVAAGLSHSCGLRDDGTAVCWGNNSTGQADPPDVQLTAITASSWHSCGLNAGDGIVCWGNDSGSARFDPASVGVRIVTGPDQPDPRECRPFGFGRGLSSGFPLSKDVPSTTGRLRVAVLFVDFSNAPALNSAQQESLKGLTYIKQYLETSSYRKLHIDFVALYRWLRAERGYSHYEGRVTTGPDHVVRAIDREAVRLADPDFDFSGVGAVMIVMPSAHFGDGYAGGHADAAHSRPGSVAWVGLCRPAGGGDIGPAGHH